MVLGLCPPEAISGNQPATISLYECCNGGRADGHCILVLEALHIRVRMSARMYVPFVPPGGAFAGIRFKVRFVNKADLQEMTAELDRDENATIHECVSDVLNLRTPPHGRFDKRFTYDFWSQHYYQENRPMPAAFRRSLLEKIHG